MLFGIHGHRNLQYTWLQSRRMMVATTLMHLAKAAVFPFASQKSYSHCGLEWLEGPLPSACMQTLLIRSVRNDCPPAGLLGFIARG